MKKMVLIMAMLMTFGVALSAQQKVKFAYDVTLDTYFDNREFAPSGDAIAKSMTIFGGRLTPEIGFTAVSAGKTEGREVYHRLMGGVDIMKTFGSSQLPKDAFQEITFYYQLRTKLTDKCGFEMNAGIFPRTRSKGYYSEAFFSDSLKFYDPNYEGIQFSWERPKAYFELGVDWLGEFGTDETTREQFMLYSAGNGKVLPWLNLGYSAYMIHYANSLAAKGLVDNLLASLYADFDFSDMVPLQKLSFMAAYMQAGQQDRKFIHKYTLPMGGEFTAEVRNWNVGIRNKTYVGYSLMPYYNNIDETGVKYGNNLYFGDNLYRLSPGLECVLDPYEHTAAIPEGQTYSKGKAGVYDCLEAYWEPKLAAGLFLRLGARFHFNQSGYLGCNQTIAIRFNLEELLTKVNYPKAKDFWASGFADDRLP